MAGDMLTRNSEIEQVDSIIKGNPLICNFWCSEKLSGSFKQGNDMTYYKDNRL